MENKIVKHKLERIRTIKEKLAQLPAVEAEVTELSTLEAVKLLRPEVIALLRKGYTLEMIVKVLEQHGFTVTISTLRKYRSAKRTEPQRKSGRKNETSQMESALPMQQAASKVAAKVVRHRSKADPDAQKNGAFTPLEDTRDI